MSNMNCERCGKSEDVKNLYVYGASDMQKIEVEKGGWIFSNIGCYDCQQKFIKEHTCSCCDCGASFMSHYSHSTRCDECQLIYANRSRTVFTQKKRTLEKGFSSSLDTYGWMNTLEHFKHKCVYCGKRYEVLDHYIPVDKGGSTNANNCVPACWKCNSKKRARMPRDFTSTEKADWIESYLVSVG